MHCKMFCVYFFSHAQISTAGRAAALGAISTKLLQPSSIRTIHSTRSQSIL
jgi:hypothetical protein